MKYEISDNFARTENIISVLRIGNLENVKAPFFSVVIPTYKRVDTLKKAVWSAIEQDGVDFPYEIIVVDNDDSVEVNETEKVLRELNIPNLYYYKHEKNLGPAGNWNRGIYLARSNWVIMCHDDDWIHSDCLKTMKDIICLHSKDKKEIGYIRSSAESWFEADIQVESRQQNNFRPKKKKTALIRQNYSNVIWSGGATWVGAPTCGTLLNRNAVLQVGGYNPDLTPCFDCYVPYHMLNDYAIYKTYYSFGTYRWGENDTYKKETLIGLIQAYNEFLSILSKENQLVKFFANEHFIDCVRYYQCKGHEAGIDIMDGEIEVIRDLNYSELKLKLLYVCRRVNNAMKVLFAH